MEGPGVVTAGRAWGRWAALAVLVTLAACAPGPLAVPADPQVDPPTLPPAASRPSSPTGHVTVAYPAPPSRLVRPVGAEPAVDDLAMVWGLPLLRVGPDGHVRRGLVADWEVRPADEGRQRVVLHLRDGRWTDGTAVIAADVVATLEQRIAQAPERFAELLQVAAPAPDRVRLVLSGAHRNWTDLLLDAGGVLPASQVRAATDGPRDDLPVTGGPFRLTSHDPGHRMAFAAHPDGPLGPPGVERLVVLFTPSYETALGLLDEGTVDVVLGHLALNPVARATALDGVRAGAPVGGTTVGLHFRPAGALGGATAADLRRGLLGALEVDELVEGLLGRHGEVATSPWPGVPAPAAVPGGEVPDARTVTLMHPLEDEALRFTVRAIQRDLRRRDVVTELVGEPRPDVEAVARTDHDVVLRARRTGPRPSLVPWVDDPEVARRAHAAGPGTAAGREGLAAVARTARYGPLYRVGVAHAWRRVEGIRPSSWLGAGFWNVGEWTRSP